MGISQNWATIHFLTFMIGLGTVTVPMGVSFSLLMCYNECILRLKVSVQFSSVQSFSHVRLFATPETAAHQASLSITNSWSLLKFMCIELVVPSNHLILCFPLLLLPSLFPSIRSFPMSQFFTSGGQSIGVSASASVLPVNIQD